MRYKKTSPPDCPGDSFTYGLEKRLLEDNFEGFSVRNDEVNTCSQIDVD